MSNSLSQSDKEYYIQLIHKLWPHTRVYSKNDVSKDVAEIVDRVLDESVNATRLIAVTLQIPAEILSALREKDPLKFSQAAYDAWSRIYDILHSNRRYKFVLDTIVLKYKSLIELALMGL